MVRPPSFHSSRPLGSDSAAVARDLDGGEELARHRPQPGRGAGQPGDVESLGVQPRADRQSSRVEAPGDLRVSEICVARGRQVQPSAIGGDRRENRRRIFRAAYESSTTPLPSSVWSSRTSTASARRFRWGRAQRPVRSTRARRRPFKMRGDADRSRAATPPVAGRADPARRENDTRASARLSGLRQPNRGGVEARGGREQRGVASGDGSLGVHCPAGRAPGAARRRWGESGPCWHPPPGPPACPARS